MRYRVLGKTGLFVSEMCLGTMNFETNLGKYAEAGGLTAAEAEPIFRRAFSHSMPSLLSTRAGRESGST